MRWERSLPVAVVLSALAGWLIFRLWEPLGLPHRGGPLDAPFPGLWRWLFAIWLPALFPAFTLVHGLLARWSQAGETSSAVARRALPWDRLSYTLLPLFLVLMIAWAGIGDWRLPFAAFFVSVLFGKVLLLVATLYRGVFLRRRDDDGCGDPPGLELRLFLAAFLPYAFLTPYVITAVSTAGDEHIYLLNTQSLRVDGDVDIRNNVERRDYEKFYWGRPAPATWTTQFLGFPALLLPGYALGSALLPHYPLAGRLGATLTIGLFAALLGVQVYRLCRELGAAPAAAFWAWAVVALTPPVLVNSGHVYPELPAAFAAVVAARALLRIPEVTWSGLLIVAGAVAFMVVLKDRYAPLGLGLVLWAFARLATRRARLALALFSGFLAAGFYLASHNPLPQLFQNLGTPAQLRETLLAWNGYMPLAAVGLVADQEFGLLYYGPHWTLAFVGIGLLWRRNRETAAGLVGLVLFYLVVLVKYRWIQWDAGWTPPPRFLLSAAPLLAPFIAESFDHHRGRALATVNTLWLVWCSAIAFLLSVVPFWRYNNLDGRSTLPQLAGDQLGLDLARFLPSLRAPTAWTWAALTLWVVLLFATCAYAAGRRRAAADGWGVGAVLLRPAHAGALVVALVLLWLSAAALVPTWSVEAEAMRHSGGVQFGSYQNQDIVWVMKQEGEIAERIVTWPGLTEVTVIAGGYSTTGAAPRMRLLLDDRPLEAWTLRSGHGAWVETAYVGRVRTAFGRPMLRLEFADLLDQRATGRVQHAYVDRIRLRRINETPATASTRDRPRRLVGP